MGKKNVILLMWVVFWLRAWLALSLTRVTDESALLAFNAHITHDPTNILAKNWSEGTSFCNWVGVSCGRRHQRVTALNLPNMGLRGTIPKEIGNLSFLISINISSNNFHGHLPHELGLLHRLKSLDLQFNEFSGYIPKSFGLLTKIQDMNLSDNSFTGSIPQEIGNLSDLHRVRFRNNSISGSIPYAIFNISSLQWISLSYNKLSGTLPVDMCTHLPVLESFFASSNYLSDEIPSSLSLCGELRQLYLRENNFIGSVPAAIGNLTKLEELGLSANNLNGELSPAFFNISSLVALYLSSNEIFGSLPKDLCHKLPRIEFIYLYENQLSGEISPILSHCEGLEELCVWSNQFTGELSPAFFNISSLVVLDLSSNEIFGSLPKDLCHKFPRIEFINLGENQLSGEISPILSHCERLEELHLSQNQFTGMLPRSIGNMSMLKILNTMENNIHGQLPQELGQLLNLEELQLSSNKLIGELRESIFNTSTLQLISLAGNDLSGNLPSNIGLCLPNLDRLLLGGNKFGGVIPESLSNASKLTKLDLSDNFFNGNVPNNLGNLHLLEKFSLADNQLTNDPSTPELSFLTSLTNCRNLTALLIGPNPLDGILPKSLGNLSIYLEWFSARGSRIKGMIPSEIGNLSNLLELYLGDNDLTGPIPKTLGQLRKIQRLNISGNRIQGLIPFNFCNLTNLGELILSINQLSGPIPRCLGKLTSLRLLYLDSNALTSKIPRTLWSLEDINVLDLSSNGLVGALPPEVGNLKHVRELHLSKNKFIGEIPTTIGQLQYLESLDLSQNRLQGHIPLLFSDLISLKSLNLSQNNLSGVIPKSLEKLSYLKYLNVSLNRLSGEIPNGGPFSNFKAESFMHNDALCGAPRFHVRACKAHKSEKDKRFLKYAVPSIASVVIAAALLLWLLRSRNKKRQLPLQVDQELAITHRRISYQEILRATSNFREDNLIGRGRYGMVYKGIFVDGMVAAIKVFNLEIQSAFKSFEVECEALRNIRHRNLVEIISSCSNTDFRALVLEYMPNGNLEKWLYSHNYFLNIVQRLSIVIDVASAFEYLHHGNSIPVVHCDLKPSNILLDQDMVAHVGDFGIAKLLKENKLITQTKTLGTIGYMAPEYGSAGIVSTKGDVYSFGILLMETFTRKSPTDDLLFGNQSLKHWVNDSFPSAVMEVVDANLLREERGNPIAVKNCFLSIMELALQCTTDSPKERIVMTEVLVRLKKIKNSFQENIMGIASIVL